MFIPINYTQNNKYIYIIKTNRKMENVMKTNTLLYIYII